jgi:adenine-specific DNA-methyltransferase
VKAPATTQKLRGGYYTPPPIARFLADWAIGSTAATVLEPSCGDGNVLEAAVEVLLAHGADRTSISRLVHGVELDAEEARKAARRFSARGIPILDNVRVGDFFQYCEQHLFGELRFDAVIGNPPFIRYQDFQEAHRAVAFRLMKHAGLRPTRLTNAWSPFLVAATLLLNPRGGRLAMVIPAELLQVSYAAELRQFLTDCYSKITLVTFRKLVFDGIQQEVVLFLGERDGQDHTGIRTIELNGLDDLSSYRHEPVADTPLKAMDHSLDARCVHAAPGTQPSQAHPQRNGRDLHGHDSPRPAHHEATATSGRRGISQLPDLCVCRSHRPKLRRRCPGAGAQRGRNLTAALAECRKTRLRRDERPRGQR